MSVYFIQAGEGGPVKIGYAKDFTIRISKIQADNHEPLVALACIGGDQEVERKLHKQFWRHRIRGEWFRPADEVLAFIAALDPAERLSGGAFGSPEDLEALKAREGLSYAEMIDALGGPFALTGKINAFHRRDVHAGTVGAWRRKNWAPWWSHQMLASLCIRDGVKHPPEKVARWVEILRQEAA